MSTNQPKGSLREVTRDYVTRTGCTHVHPGYGFLGESSKFASLFNHAPSVSSSVTPGVIFVGPSVETLKITSDKMLSRDLAVSLGVPVAPGSSVASIPDVRQFIAKSGGNAFPIVLKALDGGGGRGIRLVHQLDQIEDAYERSVAPAYRAVSSMLMNVASKVLGREPL